MDHNSIEIRVNRIKRQLERYANNSEHNIDIELVSKTTIDLLQLKENYPFDMLMILDQIGCMRNWGHLGCGMIDWWIPSSIQSAFTEERCIYGLLDSNFINPSGLLFFAWDCDAKCYFYDITVSPWKVVVCDGLEPSLFNDNPQRYGNDWDGRVFLWEEPESSNALSIIERWVF